MGITELLTVAEVATILKTSRQQVRKMIHLELLPALMVGREYRIPVKFLEGFIAEAMA